MYCRLEIKGVLAPVAHIPILLSLIINCKMHRLGPNTAIVYLPCNASLYVLMALILTLIQRVEPKHANSDL